MVRGRGRSAATGDWFCLRRKVCNGCWLQGSLGQDLKRGSNGAGAEELDG